MPVQHVNRTLVLGHCESLSTLSSSKYHQSHLHLAWLFSSHLCYLHHILLLVPLCHHLDYHLLHNVSSDTFSKDLVEFLRHEVLKDPKQFLVIILFIFCPHIAEPFQMLSPSFMILVFYDALHDVSPCHLGARLFLTHFFVFPYSRMAMSNAVTLLRKVWSYSIYSIAESNHYLQRDLHTCQWTSGSDLLGHT